VRWGNGPPLTLNGYLKKVFVGKLKKVAYHAATRYYAYI